MISTFIAAALLSGQAPKSDQIEIKDDVVGKGAVAKSGDIVSVDYTGTLTNGVQFDSSIGRSPFMFLVGGGQVIKGWDQGLVGMREGGKRELTIPPSLGYGDRAMGTSIPANSTLHFTVSLLKIEPRVQITVLTPGTGSLEAKIGDVARVYFTGGIKGSGKLLFDSKDNQADPIAILVGQRTLPIGFIPALVGMKEGEKRKVDIPSELAYGSKGIPGEDKVTPGKPTIKAGSLVPPNSDLEFTFQLVKLEKQ